MDNFLEVVGSVYDETRAKLLLFIYKNDEVCVCQMQESFEMIQSRISRHLGILKSAGFLSVDRRGRWAYYSIKEDLDSFRNSILEELDSLDISLPQLNPDCPICKE